MKETEVMDVVTIGSHVIVQKLNFRKVYRVSGTGTLTLGKEDIFMSEIIGKPYWTTYKVISSQEKRDNRSRRNPPSTLVVAEKCDSLEDLKNIVPSGYDNRSINDDGKSQKLSKEDILGFRDAGKSGREIVSSLIENNASFTEKTEFSQEKYIRKKEKKYCQFLSIHKPTLPLLQEIYLRQDPTKIYGLRMDAVAQILSYSDVKCDGKFILYDSGSAGLVPAGMLSRIGAGTSGKLLYFHSGDHLPQMPIARAMNFPQEQFDRLVTVSIFDFLRTYNKGKNDSDNATNSDKVSTENDKIIIDDTKDLNVTKDSVDKNIKVSTENNKIIVDDTEDPDVTKDSIDNNENISIEKCDTTVHNDLKRKNTDNKQEERPVVKKSRKVLEIERSVELMSDTKADSLTVIAKEHPLNIVKGLLPFVKPSRPFVIYHAYREPLEETYIALKQDSDVVNLKLFFNFLRSYQVLPDRTHPDIMMNDCGGYILTGYTVS